VKFAAVILAGGKSERMGRSKALLPLEGQTFADRLVLTLSEVCDPVILVLGHQAEAVRAQLQSNPVIAVNADYERGQLSSLQCGLRSLPADIDGFFFTPVDIPAFSSSTVRALASSFSGSTTPFVVPRFDGKHGHPVLVHAAIKDEFIALPLTAQARDLVHSYRDRTTYVDVDDRFVVNDVDDPGEYESLLRSKS
jgi:molybdenum cofactor cytidylyltransferase